MEPVDRLRVRRCEEEARQGVGFDSRDAGTTKFKLDSLLVAAALDTRPVVFGVFNES